LEDVEAREFPHEKEKPEKDLGLSYTALLD
jgi:hypothetical protein